MKESVKGKRSALPLLYLCSLNSCATVFVGLMVALVSPLLLCVYFTIDVFIYFSPEFFLYSA